MSISSTLRVTLLALVLANTVNCFTLPQSTNRVSSSLFMATNDELPCSRRNMLQKGLTAFGIASVLATAAPHEASATYSAYSNREKDWQERQASGDIQISTARDLKRQLREIAPMNGENTKIFCPNGPSSNVSPLMENKCGDRLAMPSVYGRTTDAVGNSIPGFAGGKYPSAIPGDSSSLSANPLVGGFPKY